MAFAGTVDAPRPLANGRLDPRLLAMMVDFVYHSIEEAPHLFAPLAVEAKPVCILFVFLHALPLGGALS